jgi:hypothetical protein
MENDVERVTPKNRKSPGESFSAIDQFQVNTLVSIFKFGQTSRD